MDPQLLQSETFNRALADYYYLINRGYPDKGTLKLVGDRYGLRTEIRTLLYRGVSSDAASELRSGRLVQVPVSPLIIDGYNVLLTLISYRLGYFVFVSTDFICRDTGMLFGKIKDEDLLSECVLQLCSYILQFNELQIVIYLDEPVSNSIEHRDLLISALIGKKEAVVKLVPSADKEILLHDQGSIATSDSELIDRSLLSIIDIPHQILLKQYNANLLNLKSRIVHPFV